MSNALKKKKPSQFSKMINSRSERKQDPQDRLIDKTAQTMTYSFFLALKDDFGFGLKKMQNFYDKTKVLNREYSERHLVDGLKIEEMLCKCKQIGINPYEFIKGIPMKQKQYMIPNGYAKNQKSNIGKDFKVLDASLLLVTMITILTLREYYKFSLKNIEILLSRTRNNVDCMTTMQKCKKPYLSKDDVEQIFREELKLDLITGKKVA